MRLKLAFAGAPDNAARVLAGLLENPDCEISHVYTQPDRRRGRGRRVTATPVKLLAQQHGLPVRQPAHPQELAEDEALRAVDALVVVAYGLILTEQTLALPRLGCINVHASLLPRWRGAAPIARALEAGDKTTGISIMRMDSGIDTGGILLQESCAIHPTDTSASLTARLAELGSACLAQALARLARGDINPVEQTESEATYASKIDKQEAEIDWALTAEQLERKVRAFNPAPVAHTILNGIRLRVWEAMAIDTASGAPRPGQILSYTAAGLDVAAGDRPLRLLTIQLENRKKQSVRDLRNGYPNLFGEAGN